MKKITTVLAALILLSCFSSFATAETINYTDLSKHWPNFGTYYENPVDVIGTPNLKSGTFVVNDNSLDQITLDYYAQSLTGQAPGDWFINVDNDSVWDYVITTTSDYRGLKTSTAFANINSETAWVAYSVSISYGDLNNYIRSYALNGDLTHWNIRDCHPALAQSSFLNDDNIVSDVVFSGFFAGTNTASWTFSDALGLGETGSFTYGFAMTCANDVLYGTANYEVVPNPDPGPNPVPEPGTALLLGLGLLGLAATGRRGRA